MSNYSTNMTRELSFSKTVNQLFFGVDVSNQSISIFDSLLDVPELQHQYNGQRQQSFSIIMEMKSGKASSTRHEFSFTQCPLTGLQIDKGVIEIVIGEAEKTRELLNIFWKAQFNKQEEATSYFATLKQIFKSVSTKKKFEFDKDVRHIAQFSTRKETEKGIRNISLFFAQLPNAEKYGIALFLGNEI